MSAELHSVTWEGDNATFHCAGDADSPCHNFPDCECEEWSLKHEAVHPSVPHVDLCWVLTWLDAIGADDCWEGDEDGIGKLPERRDAVVRAGWSGDSECVLWEYADAEVSA